MVFIGDKSLQQTLQRSLEKNMRENADSMEKLSSGSVFTQALNLVLNHACSTDV
jgi:flagellin-like hook-associated protein FlgL